MSVIHLADGTYAGLEWIGTRTRWSTRSPRLARRLCQTTSPVTKSAALLATAWRNPWDANSTRRICRACPAQAAPGLGDGPRITSGLWGGTAEDERRARRAIYREEVATEASRSPLRG